MLTAGAPVQMHSRHRRSDGARRRKQAGIMGIFSSILTVACTPLLYFLIIALSSEGEVL